MINFSLVNLILYNFLENNIKWAIILHCWDVKTQLHLADQAMNQNVYIQFWSINNIDLTTPLEGHYLVKDRPLLGIYIDMNCSNSLEVLKKSSEEKLFKEHFHWLIYDSLGDLPKFRDLFGRFQMAVDADVTLFMDNQNLINSPLNSSFILYDVYNNGYNLGGKLNMTIDREIKCSKRSCEVKQYLSSLHEKPKLEHRWYLRDITMRVSAVVTYLPLTDPPEKLLAYLSSTKDKYQDGVAKFGFQYLMILKENLKCNFRYNFTNLWSVTEDTGGSVGAVGIEGTADISSTPFLSSLSRLKYIQAMMILGNFRQVCIFRTPLNSGIQGAVFFEPFSARVWILFGVVLILAAVLLWLTFFVEFHQMKAMLGFVPSILTTCLIAFGSACYQGSFLIPSSTGGRTVFITLSLLTFIMYNYYTSIVVSILLDSPVKSNIKTMGQLADSNLEIGMVPLPYTMTYLNISPRADIKRFVRNKIESKRNPDKVWMSVDVGLHRVRVEPGFVFVLESFSGYDLIKKTYTEQEICDLNEVPFRPEQPLYLHLHKNSSFKKIIKLKQLRIMESGIYSRHNHLFGKGRLTCSMSSNSLIQVGLEYTAPLFIMLATAYIVVLLLMFLELMWQKFERKLRMRPEKENVEERKAKGMLKEKIRM